MFGLLGGLAMMAFGLGCEAHDTAKAVRASYAFETAPTLRETLIKSSHYAANMV